MAERLQRRCGWSTAAAVARWTARFPTRASSRRLGLGGEPRARRGEDQSEGGRQVGRHHAFTHIFPVISKLYLLPWYLFDAVRRSFESLLTKINAPEVFSKI